MSKIPTEWRRQLAAQPDSSISAILRVNQDPVSLAAKVEEAGLAIRYTYSLLPGFAVEGPASGLFTLENEPWLVDITSDRSVHTMK